MFGTSNEEQYTFVIISRSIFLRMRNVSDKSCRGKCTFYFWCGFDRSSSL